MKIQPPKLNIPDSNPYQFDLFNRKQFGDSLTALLQNTEESVVLCIDAPWGEGKSTFAEMWLKDLKLHDINCIYYNAYEHDYSEDPFIAFSAEIISSANNNFKLNTNIKKISKRFKDKAIRVGKKLLTTGANIGIKALTLGIINKSDIESIESIRQDIANDSSNLFSNYIENKFKEYDKEKDALVGFKKELESLGKEIRSIQKMPLLIIIDELDRCRPDYALTLIERMKHIFNVDNVSFVILTNVNQLEVYVNTIYGENIDSHNYLHKFFTLTTDLPLKAKDGNTTDYNKYITYLSNHHGLNNYSQQFDSVLEGLFKHYNFSLREMERCFSLLAIYFANLPEKKFNVPVLSGFLSVLRIRFPLEFNKLMSKSLSYTELALVLKLDNINEGRGSNYPKEWFHSMLKYFLLTEIELKALGPNSEILEYASITSNYHRIERNSVVPLLCEELIKFNIKK